MAQSRLSGGWGKALEACQPPTAASPTECLQFWPADVYVAGRLRSTEQMTSSKHRSTSLDAKILWSTWSTVLVKSMKTVRRLALIDSSICQWCNHADQSVRCRTLLEGAVLAIVRSTAHSLKEILDNTDLCISSDISFNLDVADRNLTTRRDATSLNFATFSYNGLQTIPEKQYFSNSSTIRLLVEPLHWQN